jgi:putative membrane protein
MAAVTSVDPRLLQANERTMLAWIRTGIALITFGFVIARIGVWLRALSGGARVLEARSPGTIWIGAAFAGMGVLANAMAIRRYLVSKRAIRSGQDLRDDAFPIVFATLVTVMGAGLGAYLLLQLGR